MLVQGESAAETFLEFFMLLLFVIPLGTVVDQCVANFD